MNLTGYHQGTDPTRDSDIDPTMGDAAGTLTATQSAAALDAGFVALGNTSTNLTASTLISAPGQTVTFMASVSSSYLGPTPTGTVLFYNGLTLLGSVPVSPGMMGSQASMTISTLPLGSNPITAVYSGDATFLTSTSSLLNETVQQATTFTSLSESSPTSAPTQAVTFTAMVSSSYLGSNPTGTVNFFDGPTLLGTVGLTAGMMGSQASFTTSTLPLGGNLITAVYSGDATFLTSTSSALTELVQQASTSISLTESAPSSWPTQAVTFTAMISSSYLASAPTGTVAFLDGTTLLGTVGVTPGMMGGQAIFTTSALALGSHDIRAVYSGDTPNAGSTSSSVNQLVWQAATTTTLSESASSTWPTQAVTFTATIATSTYRGMNPTGTVSFFDGGTLVGTAGVTSTMMGGQAIFTTSALALGNHNITAVYSGDSPYAGSTSSAVTQLVWQAATTTTLSSSTSSLFVGQNVTFTTTISPAIYRAVNPTGTVSFFDGTTLLGTTGLSLSQATITTSAFLPGNHTIHAVYSGDNPYAGSTSSTLTEMVWQSPTGTSLSESRSVSIPGQAVTFFASVVPTYGNGSPTGSLTFFDSGALIATVGLTQSMGGQASFTTSALALGNHNIIAVYSGDFSYIGSSSSSVTETVQKGTTFTYLSSSAASALPGQVVTITASVGSPNFGGANPTGSVSFFDGSNFLTTVTLTQVMGGQASFTTSSLPLGNHPITAVYSGDLSYLGSTSYALNEVVEHPVASISLGASTLTSSPGQPVTFTANVSSPSSGPIPTGIVTFFDGSTVLGSVTLIAGTVDSHASFTTTTLGVGNHDITAVYGGSASYTGSTSSVVTETVQQSTLLTTTTSLTSNSSYTMAGQAVTFTAMVMKSGTGALPTGSVTIYDGTVSLGSVAVSSYMGMGGQAALMISTLSGGSHSITAVYSGDNTYASSPSPAITQTVQRNSVMGVESTSNSSAMYGQAVTFTATIYSGSQSFAPTGTVSFYDGSTLLATVALNQVGMSYQAVFTTSSLSKGSHTITSVYSGDQNFFGTSFSLTEYVF